MTTIEDIFKVYEDTNIGAHIYVPLVMSPEDVARLDRLNKRLDKSRCQVVSAALKLFEDGLDAVDAGMQKINSISMEVVTDGSRE